MQREMTIISGETRITEKRCSDRRHKEVKTDKFTYGVEKNPRKKDNI